MQIALIDDEREIQQSVKTLIQDYGRRHNIPVQIDLYETVKSFLDPSQTNKYSLILIDIYLKDENGIELASKIKEHDENALLSFLTSSPDHMPSAFALHAYDYILKPVSQERIDTLMEDVLKVVPGSVEYIELVESRRKSLVMVTDIVSAVSEGHYLNISCREGQTIKPRMTVSQFLDLASNDPRFFVVNKGIVVNADYISNIRDHCCYMKDGSVYPTRIRDFAKTEEAITKYKFEQMRKRQKRFR